MVREELRNLKDLRAHEWAVFIPMILVVLWMGLYPSSFLKPIAPSVHKLITNYQQQLQLNRTADTTSKIPNDEHNIAYK